ncbi:MAG TPA: TetR family transcriptional regulator [Tepidisphaeraceae bacterium]|jgi:AcrR family transcriptional regulator|nr:TetR family transcriptional regulator [Tepidisphaeraceae bacterium]
MASGDAKRMLPLVARGFAELGYRRATTAALAQRCGVRENVLYRAWPSKKAMFLAAIDFVWQRSTEIWTRLAADAGANGAEAARLILEYESKHHGEMGLYKLIFAGLTEAHDPQIASALRRMYRRFHQFIAEQVAMLRADVPAGGLAAEPSDAVRAWGVLGAATMIHVDRELNLFGAAERATLFGQLAHLLIDPAWAGRDAE